MQSVLWVSIYVCVEEKEEEMSYNAKDPPWSSVHRRVRRIRSQLINTMHQKMTLAVLA
jgi:hypothetical protein